MIIIAHHPMRLLKRERRRALIFSKYLYIETLAPQIFVRSLANLLVKNA